MRIERFYKSKHLLIDAYHVMVIIMGNEHSNPSSTNGK